MGKINIHLDDELSKVVYRVSCALMYAHHKFILVNVNFHASVFHACYSMLDCKLNSLFVCQYYLLYKKELIVNYKSIFSSGSD